MTENKDLKNTLSSLSKIVNNMPEYSETTKKITYTETTGTRGGLMNKSLIFVLSIFIMSMFLVVNPNATDNASAVIQDCVSVTLNTSTYTAVELPDLPRCRSISAWTSDGTSFYIASDDAGTGEALVPENSAYNNWCVRDTSGVIFYAKASAGTPVLYISWAENPS